MEHHERWDGTGYPRGLAGGDISLAGRIVAVADVFEVMTTHRPYRRPVSASAARAELARCAGSQFDPAVVRAFLNVSLGRLRRVMGPVSWLAQLPFIGALPSLKGPVATAGRSGLAAAGAATGVGALAVLGAIGPNPPNPPASPPGAPTVQPGPVATGQGSTSAGGAGLTAGRDARGGGQPPARPSATPPATGKPDPAATPRPTRGTPLPRRPVSQPPVSIRLDLSAGLGAEVNIDQNVGVDVRVGDQTVSVGTGPP